MSFSIGSPTKTTTVTLTCGGEKRTYNFELGKHATGLTLANCLKGADSKGGDFGLATGTKEEFKIENKSLFDKIVNFLNYLENLDKKAGISEADFDKLNYEPEVFDVAPSGNGGDFYKPNKDGYSVTGSEWNFCISNNANTMEKDGFLRLEIDF